MTKVLWAFAGIVAVLVVLSVFWYVLVRIAAILIVVGGLWLLGRYLINRNSTNKPSS